MDGKYYVAENIKDYDLGIDPLLPPDPPTLISPVNGETVGKSLNLNYQESDRAATHQIQVAKNSLFNQIEFDRSGFTSTSNAKIDLDSCLTYYWRMKSTNTGGTGSWSDVESFTTINQDPDSITFSVTIIEENSGSGTFVGTFSTIDPDLNDQHIYTLIEGDGINDADNDFFFIKEDSLILNTDLSALEKEELLFHVKSKDGFQGVVYQSFTLRVLPYGLIAYYPFNGNAEDESKNKFHAKIKNGTLCKNRYNGEGKAIHLNGTDDYIMRNDTVAKEITGQFTIAAWVFPEKTPGPGSHATLVYDGYENGWYLLSIVEESIHFSFGSGQNYRGNDEILKENKWSFVVVTFDGTTLTTFLNNSIDMIETGTGGIPSAPHSLTIGQDNGSNFFKGIIDEVYIFNRALDRNELSRIYNNSAPTDIILSETSISEDSPVGSMVGIFIADDPDEKDTHIFFFNPRRWCKRPG
ncbi:hypothetical protein ES708_29216 [subsurface metagenome]